MNDNHSNIIEFPYRIAQWDAQTPAEVVIQQVKLAWVQTLNLAALGVRPLTTRDKQYLWRLNLLCVKHGQPTLDVDFDEESSQTASIAEELSS